jgi:hypothetical protein
MKMLLQILVSIVLHPIALVLMIVNVLGRDDLGAAKKPCGSSWG